MKISDPGVNSHLNFFADLSRLSAYSAVEEANTLREKPGLDDTWVTLGTQGGVNAQVNRQDDRALCRRRQHRVKMRPQPSI